jgi:hypothetical protein
LRVVKGGQASVHKGNSSPVLAHFRRVESFPEIPERAKVVTLFQADPALVVANRGQIKKSCVARM